MFSHLGVSPPYKSQIPGVPYRRGCFPEPLVWGGAAPAAAGTACGRGGGHGQWMLPKFSDPQAQAVSLQTSWQQRRERREGRSARTQRFLPQGASFFSLQGLRSTSRYQAKEPAQVNALDYTAGLGPSPLHALLFPFSLSLSVFLLFLIGSDHFSANC